MGTAGWDIYRQRWILTGMGFGGERVFLFSWRKNSFFEDDPRRSEKIALCCVGSTTASSEAGIAQC